jgi:hypothetical protein
VRALAQLFALSFIGAVIGSLVMLHAQGDARAAAGRDAGPPTAVFSIAPLSFDAGIETYVTDMGTVTCHGDACGISWKSDCNTCSTGAVRVDGGFALTGNAMCTVMNCWHPPPIARVKK